MLKSLFFGWDIGVKESEIVVIIGRRIGEELYIDKELKGKDAVEFINKYADKE